jgi:predicted NBD/HSP70 family sugar kinase
MRDKMDSPPPWRKPCDRLATHGSAAAPGSAFERYRFMKKKVLVVDVGGSHVKAQASGRRTMVKVDSGPDLTPRQMVDRLLDVTDGWHYDVVSIGYPGPVVRGRIAREPYNLGRGWTRFDFERAFGRPVRLINDAAMQAIGSYQGKRMLFLGLGTGLGTTLIRDGVVIPLEIAHLPYQDGETYEDVVGDAGLKRIGVRRWRRQVATVVDLMMNAVVADYTVLGGGNVRLLPTLPPRTRRGANANALRGGLRLWQDEFVLT